MKPYLWIIVAIGVGAFVYLRTGRARLSEEEAETLLSQGAIILDVRTVSEFSSGHLLDAINIPVSELKSQASELDSKKPVVVYCASGMRSRRAKGILGELGFENVIDIGSKQAGRYKFPVGRVLKP